MTAIAAALRRFRDAVALARFEFGPVTIDLSAPERDRPEPRIKAGHMVVPAGPDANRR